MASRSRADALDEVRLAGVPIHIHSSWFLIAALLTWTLATRMFPEKVPGLSLVACWLLGAAAAVLLFVCVILHELGHALTARHFGLPVGRIILFVFGGVSHLLAQPRRPRVELAIALAGPAVSAVLALACALGWQWLLAHTPSAQASAAMLRYLFIVNLGLLVFNLLPGFPLDGGRVLRAALWVLTRNFLRATQVAGVIGSLLGLALAGLGAWLMTRGLTVSGAWHMLLGWFLWMTSRASWRGRRVRARVR
jgi:Zn-dependent protease